MANRIKYTFQLYNRFSAAARAIRGDVGKIRRKFAELDFDTKKLSRNLTKAGKAMKATSLAATAGIGGSLKAFGDLEQGVYNVYTLLDDDRAVKKYGGTIRGLSEDAIKMGFGIGDANKGLFDTVSALGANERAWDAYGAAQKLAIAGVTELSISTDGLTSIMNAYGDEAKSATDVANAFFTAQKKGKTTVAALASNIGKVAPIAKQAGIGYQELLATTAQLTLGGLSTEEATTALRQAIAGLLKPSKDAEKVLKAMGVPVGATELRAAGLGKALSQLAVAGEKFPDLLSQAIPNIRAFTATAALGQDELANINSIVEQINRDIQQGTGLQAGFNLQQSAFNKEMARTWGSIKILGARIGDALAPVIKFVGFLTRGLIKILDGLGPVMGKVLGAILGIAAAAAPVLLALGKLAAAGGWIAAVFGKLVAVAKVVAVAMASSIGIAVIAVAGLAAGIYTVIKYWEDLKREFSFGALGDWIKYLFTGELPEIDVEGTVAQTQTSRADVNVMLNAPPGVVQSTKVKQTGNTPALNVGVNMAGAL